MGKIYGIIGKNGAGKTTLIKILLNQLNYSGKIEYENTNIKENLLNYKLSLSYSADESHFYLFLTGIEWLRFVVSSYHKKIDDEKLKEIIQILNFDEINNLISSYSYGMKKKLSLAISFILDTKIMLIDESLAGIDIFTSRNIIQYLKSIKKNKIIIITSHSKDLIESSVDKLFLLEKRTLKDIESFDEIFEK